VHRTWGASMAGAAIVLVAPTGGPAGAVTDDWVPDDVHDYVGLVVLLDDDGEPFSRCSGALIDDTTVLTAGRCTAGASSARIYFQADTGADDGPQSAHDPVSGYPDECAPGTLGVSCVESDSLYHAGFDGFASFPDTHDVGLVILDAPPSAVDGRGELPLAHVLDPLARGPERNRTVFTVSGYGPRESNDHVESGRSRLMASSRLTNLRSSLNDGFNLQTNGNGRGFAGTCSGDAGAPVFLGDFDSDTIVAVSSFGLDSWCRGTDFSARIDRADVLAWIGGGYLDTMPEPSD
jgi:hypothetical protein